MINKELFYVMTGIPRTLKAIQKAPRLIATPKPIAAWFLAEGFVYECYSMDGKSKTVSWFWRPKEFIIPTSPFSKLVVGEDAQIVEITYRNMINKLKNQEEFRIQYRELRNRHNQQIGERIHDMKKLCPPDNYIKLIVKKPGYLNMPRRNWWHRI